MMSLSKRRPVASVDALRSSAVLVAAVALMAAGGAPVHAQAPNQTTPVGDRYSGDAYTPPAYTPPAYTPPAYQTAASSSGPTLSWPGKSAPAAPPPPAPPSPNYGDPQRPPAYLYGAPVQAPQPSTRQATAYQTGAYQVGAYQTGAYQTGPYQPPAPSSPAPQARAYAAPPVMPWYQRFGVASSTEPSGAPAVAAPKSIYDPPSGQVGPPPGAVPSPPSPAASATAATAAASAANDGETARFYSLHRQYGLTPDPDPIPPQFFSRTADLSDPPGPSPVYKATTANGTTMTAVHPVQSDDTTSSLSPP